ncbi:MAG: repressor LexA [Candidatus Poribacteria bacterium]|nr:repressor LexA [Candidatus Poribacteria bacterium]
MSQAGEMVKSALKEKDMTQQGLAEKIGRDQTLISRFISGVPIADTTARAIAEILDLDADELVHQIQRDKLDKKMGKLKAQYKPVIGNDGFGDMNSDNKNFEVGHVGVIDGIPLLNSYDQPQEKVERYVIPTGIQLNSGRAFALKISGKNMTDDKIEEGDIIIVDPIAKMRDEDRVLVVRDNQQELRRFYRDGNTIILQSPGGTGLPIILTSHKENVKIIGRIVFCAKHFI